MSMQGPQTFSSCDDDKFSFADLENDFELVNHLLVEDEKYEPCAQASHCLIYSKYAVTLLDTFNPRALILMQFRFDGYLGFPGGVVDPGENPARALNRELSEELGLDSLVKFEIEDRVFTHYNRKKSLLLHFFAKEVSSDVFKQVEFRSIKAPEYGNEVLGILRVPLFTMNDGYRGFPAFLENKFIGNSKQQLLECLKLLKLMNAEEIEKALSAKPLYHKKKIIS